MLQQLWQIPISYLDGDKLIEGGSTKPKLWLRGKSTTVHIPSVTSHALYVNVDAIGICNTNVNPN